MNKSLIFPFSNYTTDPYQNKIPFDYIPGEIWAPITDFAADNVVPNMYYISTYGRAITVGKRVKFLAKVETNNGYYRINLRRKDGSARYTLIHRIIMLTFCPIPGCENLQVNHEDGNKANNHISNLTWVTCKENIDHAYKMNLKPIGENVHNAVLTDEQADEIGYLLSLNKYTYKEIADMFNCSPSTISDIVNGISRKYIKEKYNLQRKYKIIFSEEEVHFICREFEIYKYNGIKVDQNCYNEILFKLDKEINESNLRAIDRIFTCYTRTNISRNYNF